MSGVRADAVLAGIDVGGTSIAVRLADHSLRDLGRHARPTVVGEPERAGEQLVAVVQAACDTLGIDPARIVAAGIGVPGHADPATGIVANAVNLGWHRVALGPAVERLLGVPCALDNDVKSAAEGVRARRLLGDLRDFAYLAIGTGISAGIVVDDRVLHGGHLSAGEIGHIVIEAGGRACPCGQRGCMEAIAGAPGVVRNHAEAVAAGAPSRVAVGPATTAREVYAAAAAGDPAAGDAVRRAARALARSIAHLNSLLDLPAVAIGGGVAAAGAGFFGPLEAALDELRTESAFVARILPPDLIRGLPDGDDAQTWGAVLLARAALARGGRLPA